MKILFFSHYFPPEVNAPAARTYDHCVRWARAGHDVTVVTCVPNCPDGVVFEGYRSRWRAQVECVDGIRVVRVWTYVTANEGTVGRIANYVSYLVTAVLCGLRLPRPEVVVATTPQFFCAWAGRIVAGLRRIPFVLEVRDIWPESIAAVGALRKGFVLRRLERLERRLYRAADHIVTVGNGYRENILSKAEVAGRISVITNGVDLRKFAPRPPDPRFRHMWNLEDKFVCSYVGTIGMAHGLEVVLQAADILRRQGRSDIAFCLVGEGAARKELQDRAARTGLDGSVVFTGLQPKEEMPYILSASDACLVHLKPCELFGTVIPSKIFEIMAMQRPIIMGVNGEARRMVAQAGAGVDIDPGSPEQLAAAVARMADDPAHTAQLGTAARSYVAENYNRDVLAARFLDLLQRVAGAQGGRHDLRAEPPPALPPGGGPGVRDLEPSTIHRQPVDVTVTSPPGAAL